MTTAPDTPALEVDVWFPLYVADWLTGTATFPMSNRQRGMFVQLLCHAWKQGASLPDDPALLAKYADESLEAWAVEGAAVRAQFSVALEGGRIANPKQREVYEDSLARRTRSHARAVRGAEGRWRPGAVAPLPPPVPVVVPTVHEAAVKPATVAEILEQLPRLAEWAEEPARKRALDAYVVRATLEHGPTSLWAFLAVLNASLEGLDGPARTGDEVRVALEDHAAVGAPMNRKVIRAFLAGVRSPPAPVRSARRPAENRVTAPTTPNPLERDGGF